MSSWKDFLATKFDNLCKSIGVDPLLLMILIMLLTSLRKFKHIKIWNELNPSEKRWDIIGWIILFMLVVGYIVKTIRGE